MKIYIADDHTLFLEGFSLLLQQLNPVYSVSSYTNAEDLMRGIMQQGGMPDLIFMDIRMQYISGIEATRKLISQYPEMLIIGLSMYNEEKMVGDMITAGAMGYMLKNADRGEIEAAIKTVTGGMIYLSHEVSIRTSKNVLQKHGKRSLQMDDKKFSDRELDVMLYLCRELSAKEIASKMAMSQRSIEYHISNLMKKIGARSSTGIVIYALNHEIIRWDDL